jgi:hypothetical protein
VRRRDRRRAGWAGERRRTGRTPPDGLTLVQAPSSSAPAGQFRRSISSASWSQSAAIASRAPRRWGQRLTSRRHWAARRRSHRARRAPDMSSSRLQRLALRSGGTSAGLARLGGGHGRRRWLGLTLRTSANGFYSPTRAAKVAPRPWPADSGSASRPSTAGSLNSGARADARRGRWAMGGRRWAGPKTCCGRWRRSGTTRRWPSMPSGSRCAPGSGAVPRRSAAPCGGSACRARKVAPSRRAEP